MMSFIPSNFSELSATMMVVLRDAGRKLTGFNRRAFMALVTETLLGGSARRAEARLGWSRRCVGLGLQERRSGLRCVENFSARSKKKTEVKQPQLEADIHAIMAKHSCADPQLRTALSYTRMTAEAVRTALIVEKGWKDEQLPARRTLSDMLNRLGYRLQAVVKTRPEKKRKTPMPSSPTCTSVTMQPMPM